MHSFTHMASVPNLEICDRAAYHSPVFKGPYINVDYGFFDKTPPSRVNEQADLTDGRLLWSHGGAIRREWMPSTSHGTALRERHGRSDEHPWYEEMHRGGMFFYRWAVKFHGDNRGAQYIMAASLSIATDKHHERHKCSSKIWLPAHAAQQLDMRSRRKSQYQEGLLIGPQSQMCHHKYDRDSEEGLRSIIVRSFAFRVAHLSGVHVNNVLLSSDVSTYRCHILRSFCKEPLRQVSRKLSWATHQTLCSNVSVPEFRS